MAFVKSEKSRQEQPFDDHDLETFDPLWTEEGRNTEEIPLYIRKMESAIRAISDAHCMVLQLFYVKGLSHEQIANFLQVPGGTVKRRLFDARQSIQRVFAVPDELLSDGHVSSALLNTLTGELEKRIESKERNKPMKIAVLGDIHANIEAMQAVLADVDSQKPDRILSVGDITGYGPNPCECLALARERDITIVEGNHDRYVAGQGNLEENFHPSAIAMIYWQRGALSRDDKKFLRALPKEYSLGDVKVVHTLPVGGEEWSYILDAEQAGEAFKLNKGCIVFYGHSHVPMAFFDEDPIVYVKETSFIVPVGVGALINVGAVGQPRDGDPRASWCLYDTEKRTVELRRCLYDHRRTADKILKAGLPEKFATRLGLGR